MEKPDSNEAYIAALIERIEDLKKQMPKHSVPPAMVIKLEDLEELLEQAVQMNPGDRETHA